MKREEIILKTQDSPDFYLPFVDNAVDLATGNAGVVTGSLSYGDKGAYFNGSTSVAFNYGRHTSILAPTT